MSIDDAELGLGHIARKALDHLKAHPEGLTMRRLRELVGTVESQEHFNRRVRDIRKHYELKSIRSGAETIYRLGARKVVGDAAPISEKLRAQVLHAAHGRCQMCGKTILADQIKLQADHKIPSSWGGKTEADNLWAICEACNRGKRNFFATFDVDEMREVLAYQSVHERLAYLLKLYMPEAVPSYLLEFVANVSEQQEDWHKRLRDLRYPVIGLDIKVSKKKINGRVKSFYRLCNWLDLPPDHRRLIREYERRKKSAKLLSSELSDSSGEQ